MSIRVMSQVWANSRHKGSALIMLLAIADFADDDGYAYPAVETLASKSRMSERNTRYVLETLTRSGELLVEHGTGPKGCNRYRVQISPNMELFAEGAKIAPPEAERSEGRQSSVKRGATAIAPEPLRTTREPSVGARPRPGVNYEPSESVKAWSRHQGFEAYLDLHVAYFRNYCANQRRKPYTDIDAAFRNCVLGDFGNVRFQAKQAERRAGGAPLAVHVKKFCRYCPKPSIGNVNGIEYCSDDDHHFKAMDCVPAPDKAAA